MKQEANAVFLFIAELTGSFVPGSGDEQHKIWCGQQDYIKNNLHELDLSDEEDRKELHENMWLERLYVELDEYFKIPSYIKGKSLVRGLSVNTTVSYRTETYKWTVPIELDASASMLQYIGILLNDKRLMEMTNVIGDTLQDPWQLDGISRSMLKTAATPSLYGSSQTCSDLWRDAKIDYTIEDIANYNKEMANGPFGLANAFKDFVIDNVKPKATMKVKIWDNEFTIQCNRYRNVGEETKAYKIWDSIDEVYNTFLHTDTKKVPDLEQFRLYFQTLLIHCLDSIVMDKVMSKVMKKYGWGIPIHDAAVVSPAAAADVRKWYAEELENIYRNRNKILEEYFQSIGITQVDIYTQWDNVKSKIITPDSDITFNPMALK